MNAPNVEEPVFAEALRLPSDERAAYLAQATRGNDELRRRVESLLGSYQAGDFLEQAAAPQLRPALQITVPPTEKPGDTIGRYKLLQQIGQGGCGVVYMAEQAEPVHRRVALKIIKLGMDTKSVTARFEAERQALAMMDHPNIAKVLDAGATETGRPYFVMELVRGMKITDYCDEKKLSTNARLDLFIQVCHAIQHAHQKGIIHRDIKPSNIFVTVNDGLPVPKVIDFGIAKATGGQQLTDKTLFTAFEQFIGTPAYMSPEQAVLTSLDIDTRSDIYALGVLLYELLTSKTPFDPKELLAIGLDEMRREIQEAEPPRPSTRVSTLPDQELSTTAHRRGLEAPRLVSELRGDLDWIVMKCLEKDRARRYESASGLAMDIRRHLDHEPVVACPPSRLYRFHKLVRRNKLAFAAASAVAASLVIGSTLSTVFFFRERAAREQADEQAAVVKEGNIRERAARQRADEQAALAKAVNDFLLKDLLDQASSYSQAEAGFRPDPRLTVRQALERAAERIDDRFPDQPLQEAAVRHSIGNALLGLGSSERAIPHLKRALEVRREELGPDHTETLTSMRRMAWAYLLAGELEQALPLQEETVKCQKAKRVPDHVATVNSMGNLMVMYAASKNLEQAIQHGEEALILAKTKLGLAHQETLVLMANLARYYRDAGRRDLALSLQEETLERMKASLGKGNPFTQNVMFGLGRVYHSDGKLDEALPLLEEALELSKAGRGVEHPDTQNMMRKLADVYLDEGKSAQALSLLEERLNSMKAILGTDHADTLHSMNHLAIVYANARKLDQALPLFEETLRLRNLTLGPDHLDTLRAQGNLAVTYQRADKLDEALPLFEETLKRMKAKLGPESPETLWLMRNAVWAYHEAGKLAEAEALLRDRLTAVRERHPGDPSKLVGPVNELVEALVRQSEYAEAEQLFDEVLSGPVQDLPAAVELLRSRGRLRARRGKFADAAADLARVKQVRPEDHVAWHELAPLLVASGRLDAYREHCRQSIEQFGQADDPTAAERIAKDCLILPDSGADLETVAQMADTAAAATNHWATPWFQFVNGLAEYRRGDFTSAVEWLNKSLTESGSAFERDVEAYMVLAMAHYQLDQADEARAAYARGAEIERTKLPKLEGGDLGGGWIDWIIAHALRDEAKVLIESGSPPTTTSR